MKTLLKLEEAAQFLACLALLLMNGVPWWTYLLLVLGPDISMLGYLISTRVGAITYNVLHHKGIAALLLFLGGFREAMSQIGEWISGVNNDPDLLWMIGVILFGHASMDRMLGYGLKFGDHFQHTHLGWIGKGKSGE